MSFTNSKFSNKILEGDKGKLMLEISKSFKGDNRFKLDKRFQQDVDLQKLPQKFKQTLQKDIVQKVKQKTKGIKKQQPSLIIRRFQPGTSKAQVIVRKAQGRKNLVQNLIKSQKKKLKNKTKIKKGIDKIAKADKLLNLNKTQQPKQNNHQFQIIIKGNKKQAFKPSSFRLFQ